MLPYHMLSYFPYCLPSECFSYPSIPQMSYFLPSYETPCERKIEPIVSMISCPAGSGSLEEVEGKSIPTGICSQKEKKTATIKKKAKDEEFKQRQQTANRNLCSNTLKVYLKQVRDVLSETHASVKRTIKLHQLLITSEEFLKWLNAEFECSRTYVSYQKMRKLCQCADGAKQADKVFSLVLRVTLQRFFMFEIHNVNIKSVRTTRKIRNMQVRQGRLFLHQLRL